MAETIEGKQGAEGECVHLLMAVITDCISKADFGRGGEERKLKFRVAQQFTSLIGGVWCEAAAPDRDRAMLLHGGG